MAHFNFVISQNAKWGHAGFYIDCHRMTVPENILLQKSTDNYIKKGLLLSLPVNKIEIGVYLAMLQPRRWLSRTLRVPGQRHHVAKR